LAHLPTTRWSLIRDSGGHDGASMRAWELLLLDYRSAVLAFFRRAGAADDAEDLAQGFLADSIEQGWWARADREQGSFRRFLYMLLRRYLQHHRRRGGPTATDGIDMLIDDTPDAEHAYDMAFVGEIIRSSMAALREEYAARGRGELFDALARVLAEPPDHGLQRQLAGSLGLRANTLAVEVRRLRARLAERVRQQVRELCSDEQQFAAELQAFRAVIG